MDILKLLEEENVEIVRKGDWQVWWHYIVPIFWFFAGIFYPNKKERFMTHAVVNLGRYIYFPDPEVVKTAPQLFEGTLRHELMHVYDNRRRPIWYKVSYVCSKKWRAYWEMRGYTQNMITLYNKKGVINETHIERLRRVFSSSFYFNMHENIKPAFFKIRELIYNGELTNFDYPEEFEKIAQEEIFA